MYVNTLYIYIYIYIYIYTIHNIQNIIYTIYKPKSRVCFRYGFQITDFAMSWSNGAGGRRECCVAESKFPPSRVRAASAPSRIRKYWSFN